MSMYIHVPNPLALLAPPWLPPQSVRDDLQYNYIHSRYSQPPAFYKLEHSGEASSKRHLPLIYIYNSYFSEAGEWAKVLKPGGALSMRGRQQDRLAVALLVEHKHMQFAVDGGFDGVYTYFWSQASRPSSNWGTRCGDMMCDGMFGGSRHVAGLRDHWIFGQNSFDFISWFLGQQCRAKGYLLCPDSLYHKTGGGCPSTCYVSNLLAVRTSAGNLLLGLASMFQQPQTPSGMCDAVRD